MGPRITNSIVFHGRQKHGLSSCKNLQTLGNEQGTTWYVTVGIELPVFSVNKPPTSLKWKTSAFLKTGVHDFDFMIFTF